MQIAKAVILAGRTPHDRPWPSVTSGARHLVPVANRPILFHALESLRDAGIIEATIALEHDCAGTVMAAVGNGAPWGLAVRYVRWSPPSGIGGALVAARDFVRDEPVLVEPADALHRDRIHRHLSAFAEEGLDAMTLRLPGAPLDADGEPVPGGHLLSAEAVAALARVTRPLDPAAAVRAAGGSIRIQAVEGCLPCHGGEDRLLEGNRHKLDDLTGGADPASHPGCEFQGRVEVHPSAELRDTLVRGPAIIGAGARLSHAYVGPYTSIGAGVTIDGAQIEHSIVLDGAELAHVGVRIETSVIGRGARITRAFGVPSTLRLSVADGAEVTLT